MTGASTAKRDTLPKKIEVSPSVSSVQGPSYPPLPPVDDVDVARPRLGEQQRLCGGIVAVDRGPVHVALGQAHDLPALQVDRGEDDEVRHGIHARNLFNSAIP